MCCEQAFTGSYRRAVHDSSAYRQLQSSRAQKPDLKRTRISPIAPIDCAVQRWSAADGLFHVHGLLLLSCRCKNDEEDTRSDDNEPGSS